MNLSLTTEMRGSAILPPLAKAVRLEIWQPLLTTTRQEPTEVGPTEAHTSKAAVLGTTTTTPYAEDLATCAAFSVASANLAPKVGLMVSANPLPEASPLTREYIEVSLLA